MQPPREVGCDQCGTRAKVVRVSWNDADKNPVFTCIIVCPNCGERAVIVQGRSRMDDQRDD